MTTRGIRDEQAKDLAGWMCDVLDDINDERAISRVRNQVLELCANYPVYNNFIRANKLLLTWLRNVY